MVATSRAVMSQALRALGSAPLSSRICAVDRLPPAALNIRGVISVGVFKQQLQLFICTTIDICAYVYSMCKYLCDC